MPNTTLNTRFKPLISAATALLLSLSFASPALEDNGGTADASKAPASRVSQHKPNGYIKDDLFIYMHVGNGKNYRILGSIIAGTPIEVLSTDNETGFSQIKGPKGRTGWVEQIHISKKASTAAQLNALQRRYDQLEQSAQNEQSNVDDLARQLEQATNNAQQLQQQISHLEQKNQQQQQQLNRTVNEKQHKMMLYGSSIVVVGILFGLLMPTLVRRRRRSDGWA
jgi:SH3 domain protein